jgi:hypothetical protein
MLLKEPGIFSGLGLSDLVLAVETSLIQLNVGGDDERNRRL